MEAKDSGRSYTEVIEDACVEHLQGVSRRRRPPKPQTYSLLTIVALHFDMPRALAERAIKRGEVAVNGETEMDPEREIVGIDRVTKGAV